MAAPALSLACHRFERTALIEAVQKASEAPPDGETPAQVRYLASYLSHPDCRARTFLVEEPYVDRHYLEEFTGYYANRFQPPSHRTKRFHFFSKEIGQLDLEKLRKKAASGGYAEVTAELQDGYLGFAVIRPLPSAPVGRTILSAYHGEERCYGTPATRHRVHLAGIVLEVDGVPFQQQDRAVGACATTAVWSALSRTMRADGNRAPTPLSVTLAATRSTVLSRVLPADGGLEVGQICSAIHHFGYSPLPLRPLDEPAIFLMALKCYVRSGMPVILHLGLPGEGEKKTGDGHAATVVGFRDDHPDEPPPPIELRLSESHSLIEKGISRFYVHDDRLGPYARMRWRREDNKLEVYPYEKGWDEFEGPMQVWAAVVPLYPKLRLSATDLISFAGDLLPLVKTLLTPEERGALRVETRFEHGGRYLENLLRDARLSADRSLALTVIPLPRYVGLIRFLANEHVVEVVCDTTDIYRDSRAPLLAIVASKEADVQKLREGCPEVTVP